MKKLVLIVAATQCLTACTTLELAAFAGSGISYLTTGKSFSDHAISMVTNRDCALHNMLDDQPICLNQQETNGQLASQPNTAETNQPGIIDTTATDETVAQSTATTEAIALNKPAPVVEVATSIANTTTKTEQVVAQAVPSRDALESFKDNYFGDTWLVIGSYRYLDYAVKARTANKHLNASVVAYNTAHTNYRVVVGPFEERDLERVKQSLNVVDPKNSWKLTDCERGSGGQCFTANNYQDSIYAGTRIGRLSK